MTPLKYIIDFIKERLGDILSGFVFWLPISIIILVSSFLFSNLEDFGRSLLVLFIAEEFIHPGFGAILGIIVFMLTGIILKNTAIADWLSNGQGGMINFFQKDKNFCFEINLDAVKKSRLKISSKLLRVAASLIDESH